MNNLKQLLTEITEGIGSPFGEGATYEKGSSPTHLAKKHQENLVNDLLSLFKRSMEEIIGDEKQSKSQYEEFIVPKFVKQFIRNQLRQELRDKVSSLKA